MTLHYNTAAPVTTSPVGIYHRNSCIVGRFAFRPPPTASGLGRLAATPGRGMLRSVIPGRADAILQPPSIPSPAPSRPVRTPRWPGVGAAGRRRGFGPGLHRQGPRGGKQPRRTRVASAGGSHEWAGGVVPTGRRRSVSRRWRRCHPLQLRGDITLCSRQVRGGPAGIVQHSPIRAAWRPPDSSVGRKCRLDFPKSRYSLY
jgi:hypothetical protein